MLKRKKPLRRTGGLKRTRLTPVNRERAAKRRAECFGEQAQVCRILPCFVCETVEYGVTPVEFNAYVRRVLRDPVPAWQRTCDPHHEPPRSVGGKDGDTVPICRAHHEERHRVGRSAFERAHLVDLRAVAKAIREELAKAGREVQDE